MRTNLARTVRASRDDSATACQASSVAEKSSTTCAVPSCRSAKTNSSRLIRRLFRLLSYLSASTYPSDRLTLTAAATPPIELQRKRLACLRPPTESHRHSSRRWQDWFHCSHIAARFCQRIDDLRRVESTSIGRDGTLRDTSVPNMGPAVTTSSGEKGALD